MKNPTIGAAAALSIFAAACAHAQEAGAETQTEITPAPCSDPQFRAFDFWVGDWDVFSEDGAQIGVNSITIEEKGCLLVERWTDANGNTGQSYNFVDHATGKWRQVWVSPGMVIDYIGGADENGAMVLEGDVTTQGAKPQKFKGTWSLQGDGGVRQQFQTYDEETKQWTPVFVGVYRQKTAE